MDKKSLAENLQRFVGQYQHRHLTETEWRMPLLGFASADDSLFPELKRVVSPDHALPKDLLSNARTVVAFFLPFSKRIAQSNNPGRLASKEWAQAYIETNTLIEAIGLYMKQHIESAGYDVAMTPPTHNFDPQELVSDWSHRHVAFITGLGMFGLNNMLITESGCCGRIGSFVTSLGLPGDHRSNDEACLFHYNGSCTRCTSRCVNGALFTDHFDRYNCYQMCLENEEKHQSTGKADVCGKCLVDVPCAFVNPVKHQTDRAEQCAGVDGENASAQL